MSVVSDHLNLYLSSSKLKTKMYIALQSLELDLTKMMHMFRWTIVLILSFSIFLKAWYDIVLWQLEVLISKME